MRVRSVAALLLCGVLSASGVLSDGQVCGAEGDGEWPVLPEKNALVRLPAQEWPQKAGPRTITASIHFPDATLASVNRSTGLMLTLHNWGGTDCAGTANPDVLAKRLNVVAICVNYLQSGRQASIDDPEPYDFGYLQGLDALRAMWFVFDGLMQRDVAFDTRRIFATGGSGGGNVTQMVNKLAPRTFTCVVDMCGMAKLSDDIAFNLPGGSGLNARWSRDPDSPNWLSPAEQEIRFVGKPEHLSVLTRLKNTAKIVVVHGADDSTCPFADKQELVANMQAAGLDVEPHFITQDDLDGEVFTSSGHALGNRTEIVFRVAGKYLEPGTKTSLARRQKTDFERRDSQVGFPVTGGEFVISYEAGYPVGRFVNDEWPPRLTDAANGTVTVRSDGFLKIPDAVRSWSGEDGAAPFTVVKTPPTIDLAFQRDLGEDAIRRRLWSSWGDICLASDGRVYCGIGDHGNDAGGDARCLVYRWEPQSKTLEQVVDMNQVVPPREGQPAWSKIHAKIDEGSDGKIYFCCTLNAGSRAGDEQFRWTPELPGGQVYRFDPATGTTSVFASLPPRRCTATSLFDRDRRIWWCNLEAGGGDALWGLDLGTGRPVLQTPDGTVAFNRAIALTNDGSVLFNGVDSLWRLKPDSYELQQLKATFGDAPGMRCATRESSTGMIYGSTHKTNQLFRYDVKNDELTLLGPNWLTGQYTTVMELSPDERFLYYLPGAHGRAWEHGTPVVQYEITTGQRKVIAFLAETFERQHRYVPGGTYGIKLSRDGGTLFINFNGHAAEELRTSAMRPIGFGLCSFAAVHIPKSER